MNLRTILFGAAVSLTFLCGCSSDGSGNLSVGDLTVEYMAAPNSIDTPAPRLSWINSPINAQIQNESQSAYRIIVSSSESLLKKNQGDIWDSGKVSSDDSYLVPFAGSALSSGQDCYWKVMVWDAEDNPSSWSKTSKWTMGILDRSEWKAQWIGSTWQGEEADPNDHPAPLFRKGFNLSKKVASAKAFVTGLGYFEFYVNGSRVGDECFAPNFTMFTSRPGLRNKFISIEDDFRSYRVMYLVYDITDNLVKGDNAVGLIVGNGFYNSIKNRWNESFGSPRMICQIKVEYTDGTSELICSDPTWKVKESAIRQHDIFRGETYDARYETPDWCSASLDDSSWDNAVLRQAPEGVMSASSAPIDKVVDVLEPVSLTKCEDGRYEVEFDREISGWIHFKDIQGAEGDTLRVDFVCESADGTEMYIFKGKGKESYTPRFTWYVFSKAYISGVKELSKANLVAEAVNTDVRVNTEFTSSNTLLSGIVDIWQNTQKDNMHGAIASDCPHRERSPYTGDGEVAASFVMSNFDAAAFYQKWVRDMRDAQSVSTGYVPNSAPWQPGCGGGVPWGAAVNIIPWDFYCHYGDIKMLEDSYYAMTEQVRYMSSWQTKEGTMYSQKANFYSMQMPSMQGMPRMGGMSGPNYWLNLGDWCTPGGNPADELVHTFYYWYCTKVTAEAAKALGKSEDADIYSKKADDIAAAFHKKFYDPKTKSYGERGGNVFALVIGVPEDRLEDVKATLRDELVNKYNSHINTGIFGTRFIFEVLARYGMNDIAYAIINQKDEPGYGYWLSQGTTTWEDWDGHSSHNHPMFGGGLTYLYDCLAGVNYDVENPGFKNIVVRPYLADGLDWVCYSKNTPYGKVTSKVTNNGGKATIELTVPVGSTATVYIPNSDGTEEIKTVSQGTYTFTSER